MILLGIHYIECGKIEVRVIKKRLEEWDFSKTSFLISHK